MRTFGVPGGTVWLRRAALPLVLVLATLLPWSGTVAQTEEATAATGFLVDTGEGEPIYVVVTFAEPTNAIDLLREADLDTVTVDFGGLGAAVCSIHSTGCDVGSCRQRMCQTGDPESPFWQYWQLHDDQWRLSSLGGSHAMPVDGEIAAWVWTGVDPELEPITWNQLAERAGAPDDVIEGNISGEPAIYASGIEQKTEGESDLTEAVAGGAVVVLIAVVGGVLVLRQRRRLRGAA